MLARSIRSTWRRWASGCCHIPDAVSSCSTTCATAQPVTKTKPELWEGKAPREGCREHAFEFDVARTRFGRGVLAEVGATARNLGLKRIALVTDPVVAAQPFFEGALKSLREAGVEAVPFLETKIEPTDESFLHAARWAGDVRPDGWISIGGGSCIDTAKAANLFSTHPPPSGIDDFLHYVNAPVGRAANLPGPLKPHIACPTTPGTGSEGTGYAICDITSLGVKTALANRGLKPTLALVDPLTIHHLPRSVVAAAGMDVVMHAAESFTARPFSERPLGAAGAERPLNQGQNPWSDIGCRETLRLAGAYFARALSDDSDLEAREAMHWASTLAGTALNNAGTALPHGCSYPVSGGVKSDPRRHYAPKHGYANRAGGMQVAILLSLYWSHAIPCYTMLYHAIPCYAMLWYAMPYHAMLYHAIPCYTIPYYAMPYYAMLSILYHATPYHTIPYCANRAGGEKAMHRLQPSPSTAPSPQSRRRCCRTGMQSR